MIIAFPFDASELTPEVVEFDGYDVFLFLADNRRKAKIVSILNLWNSSGDSATQYLSIGFVLPEIAQSIKCLTEKMYGISNRQYYPATLEIEHQVAYASINLAEIPSDTNFWIGISYDVVINDDFLDLSLFIGEPASYASQLTKGVTSFLPLRKANISLIYGKSKILAAGTLSGAESEITGQELATRFKLIKSLQGPDIYSRLNWHIDYPSVNRPLNLHVLLSGESVSTEQTQDLQTIVLNLSQQVKAIEREVVQVNYRVGEMRADLNRLIR